MQNTSIPSEAGPLTPDQQAAWHADVAALRAEMQHHDLHPLRIGDLFNEMQRRWQEKMPAVARAAGVPYHTARRRARVAACIPPTSRIRDLDFPYAILRMLAPLQDPQRWAEQAWALQQRGKLRVDTFAALLEKAGVRQPRTLRIPHCLHCGGAAPDDPRRVHARQGDTTAWLCGPRCAAAYFHAQEHPEAAELPTAPPPTSPARETHAPMSDDGLQGPSVENETRVSIEPRGAGFPAGVPSGCTPAGEPSNGGRGPTPVLEPRVSIDESSPRSTSGEIEPRVSIDADGQCPAASENETRVSIDADKQPASTAENEPRVSFQLPERQPPPERTSGPTVPTHARPTPRRGRPPQPGRGPSRRDRRARAAPCRGRGRSRPHAHNVPRPA